MSKTKRHGLYIVCIQELQVSSITEEENINYFQNYLSADMIVLFRIPSFPSKYMVATTYTKTKCKQSLLYLSGFSLWDLAIVECTKPLIKALNISRPIWIWWRTCKCWDETLIRMFRCNRHNPWNTTLFFLTKIFDVENYMCEGWGYTSMYSIFQKKICHTMEYTLKVPCTGSIAGIWNFGREIVTICLIARCIFPLYSLILRVLFILQRNLSIW